MLLHGVLKCYVLYFLFVLCATVKQQKNPKVDKQVRSLRRIGDSEQPDNDALASSDDANNKDDKIDGNKNDEDELSIEANEANKESNAISGGDDESDKPLLINESISQNAIEEIDAIKESDDEPDKPQPTNESDNQKSIENNEMSKEHEKIALGESDSDNQGVFLKGDNPGVDKVLEIKKLSSVTGFDYSQAEAEKFKIWPLGVIPYYIDKFSYDKVTSDKIREYLDEASSLTGLRFLEIQRPPTDENTRWVFILNRRFQLECVDYNDKSFTNSGIQKVTIGYNCLNSFKSIAYIVLALAGVPPQHNSPDRDNYIEVNRDVIVPDKVGLFTLVKPEDWLFYDVKYDFHSAGHYSSHKYTSNGSATIKPKKSGHSIGEETGLSSTDVLKIRLLYNFILKKDDKNAKLPDCKALYRPGPEISLAVETNEPSLLSMRKPQKYIEAAKQAGLEIVEGSKTKLEDNNVDGDDTGNSKSKTKTDDGDSKGGTNKANSDADNDDKDKNGEALYDENENQNGSDDEHQDEVLKGRQTTNPMNKIDSVVSDE